MVDWLPLTRAALPGPQGRAVARRRGEILSHARFA
ncbi:MAG: hypothetical protein JWQ76_1136, partial [Ramlibacter sp.]|nr:hypothetical protein [Ramlibacter sp.]